MLPMMTLRRHSGLVRLKPIKASVIGPPHASKPTRKALSASDMAPIGKLYGHPRQPQTKAVRSLSCYPGHTLRYLSNGESRTNRPSGFKSFPWARSPLSRITRGLGVLSVSSLVPEAGLLGHNRKETAQVDQWIHFAETEILIPASFIYGGIVAKFFPGYNDEVGLPFACFSLSRFSPRGCDSLFP